MLSTFLINIFLSFNNRFGTTVNKSTYTFSTKIFNTFYLEHYSDFKQTTITHH